MKLLIATIGLALSVAINAEEAKSIKYHTTSGSQIIITDLGLIPGGTFSSGLAINNQPVIVGLANDSGFDFKRPFWNANTGVIIGFADNFNPASTAIPEHLNGSREMAGSEVYGDNVYQGIDWNSTGQAFMLLGLAGSILSTEGFIPGLTASTVWASSWARAKKLSRIFTPTPPCG